MPAKPKSSSPLFIFLTGLIVVAGVAFWLSDLTSDPPLYFSGGGQSLSTDPPQYVHHARNNALFGSYDPFDYPRWTVFQHSLTSAVATVWFAVAGVSLGDAHLVGLFLSLGGMFFFILGLWRHHRPWVVAAFVLCYLINVTLLTYGRHPYLENGLIFIGSMMFFVYSRWGERPIGAILCGALIACAGLVGKLFGFLLLPALMLAFFFGLRHGRWKQIVYACSSFTVVGLALALTMYGHDMALAFGYFSEQSYGIKGIPVGLMSPWAFVEKLISYGFSNRLFYLTPGILMFLVFGLLMLLLMVRNQAHIREFSPTVSISLFWVTITVVVLMPLNYTPLRYALALIPAITILCLAVLDDLMRGTARQVRPPNWLALLGITYLGWIVTFHLVANIFFFQVMNFPVRTLTWSSLPGGIALALGVRWCLNRKQLIIKKKHLVILACALIGISVVTNSFRIRRYHILDNAFNIAEANDDLAKILAPDAVISGPYGPILTVDNGLRSFIHMFGVASVDSTLFDRYPITHLAVDASNWGVAKKDYPQLEPLAAITTYYIRDVVVKIFNISKVFANETARKYQETGYEKAVSLIHTGNLVEAFQVAATFYRAHPESKSAGYIYVDLLMRHGDDQQAYSVMASMAERYPTDFYVQISFAKVLQIMAIQKQDQALLNMAKQYYERGVKANRFRGGLASDTYADLMRQSGQPGR